MRRMPTEDEDQTKRKKKHSPVGLVASACTGAGMLVRCEWAGLSCSDKTDEEEDPEDDEEVRTERTGVDGRGGGTLPLKRETAGTGRGNTATACSCPSFSGVSFSALEL